MKKLIRNTILASAFGMMITQPSLKAELPTDFPPIEVTHYQDNSDGFLLMTTGVDENKLYKPYLAILDKDFNVIKYKKMPGTVSDFKIQPNGLYSFYCSNTDYKPARAGMHYLMDKEFNLVDSFALKNKVRMSIHDFLVLPNGHKLAIAHNPEYADLTDPKFGGNPNAAITNSVIHEYDINGKLVYQWDARDYIDISETFQPIKGASFMSPHLNAFELDRDGNLLCSFRWINQLIKLNRETGEIMWRAAGKTNQFTFIGEEEANAPDYFSLQHDIRRLDNGNITLYDNGNTHKPAPYSRGIEYKIDEEKKTLELVSQNVHPRKVYGSATGSMRRLTNGGALVGWANAGVSGEILCSEFDSKGELVWDIKTPKGMSAYRVHKYDNLFCDSIPYKEDELAKGAEYPLKINGSDNLSPFSVLINDYTGIIYNSVIVSELECSDVNPMFEGITPIVAPKAYHVNYLAMTTVDMNIKYDLSKHTYFKDKSKVLVYFKAEGEDTYRNTNASFDKLNNTLTFNVKSKGKFVFAIEQKIRAAQKPFLKSPANGDTLLISEKPVEFKWNANGHTDSYVLEVATEAEFINTVDELEQNESVGSIPLSNGKYFWRAKAINSAGESEWSEAREININSQSFVRMLYPSGGEVFAYDSTETLAWNTNTKTDSVRVVLRNTKSNDEYELFKSAFCPMEKINWKVNNTLPEDDNYVITVYRLVSSEINENTVVYESGKFAISKFPTSVRIENYHSELFNVRLDDKNNLSIVFHNPTSLISAKLIDMKANETNLNFNQSSSSFDADLTTMNLANGVYLLHLQTNNGSYVAKIFKAD